MYSDYRFDTPRRRYALLSIILLLISLIGGSITLGILLSGGDVYFHGAASVALTLILVLTVAASFTLSLVYRGHAPASRAAFSGHLTAMCFHIIFMVATVCFGGYHFGTGLALLREGASGTASVISIAPGLCLMLSGILAVLGLRFSAHAMGKAPLPAVVSGAALSASCLFYALYLYFDASTPKNASMKLLLVLTFLFLSLFFLTEVRRVLGKPIGIFYRLVIAAAGQLCATLSVAPLVMQFTEHATEIGDVFTYLFLLITLYYVVAYTVAPHFWLSGTDTELPVADEISEEISGDCDHDIPTEPQQNMPDTAPATDTTETGDDNA